MTTNIIMFPLTYVNYEAGNKEATVIFADSSNKVVGVLGDIDKSWINKSMADTAKMLHQIGFLEVGRGKVEL